MPVVTITPSYVNPPKPGKKWGSVKDADGNFYGVPPEHLGEFQVGQSITLQYENGKEGGRFFKQIVVVPVAEQSMGSVPNQSYERNLERPYTQPKSNSHQRTDDQFYTMFVTGVVGRAMGSGKFDTPDSVLRLTKAAHDAFSWIQLQREQEPRSDG